MTCKVHFTKCHIFEDRLKRSSMRTQATQTDVRKSQPSVSVQAAKLPDVPRAQQKKVNNILTEDI